MRNFSGMERQLSQLCSCVYDKTLLVSQALLPKYSLSLEKVSVLYNGLDPLVFKPSSAQRSLYRDSLGINDKTVVIGMAAVIHKDKGQLGLIQAFEQVSAKYPEIKLVIAGNYAIQSPEYSKQVSLAIENNPNIIYQGYANPVTNFYNGCDIIINNSNSYKSESLGTSIYEAMACEKIVIAANTGGTPEIITDQIDGFLFEPDNVDDLSDKLIYVLHKFQLLDYVRVLARKKVIDKFNITVMANEYQDIITTL